MEPTVRVDGDRIDELIHRRKTNMTQVAKKMGMHYNGVKRIRDKESTSLDGLAKLCNALKCHPFDLLVAEGFPDPFSEPLVSH